MKIQNKVQILKYQTSQNKKAQDSKNYAHNNKTIAPHFASKAAAAAQKSMVNNQIKFKGNFFSKKIDPNSLEALRDVQSKLETIVWFGRNKKTNAIREAEIQLDIVKAKITKLTCSNNDSGGGWWSYGPHPSGFGV